MTNIILLNYCINIVLLLYCIKCLDSVLLSVHHSKQANIDMSSVMMMFGHQPTMPFQMVGIAKVSTEATSEEIGECPLGHPGSYET